MHYQIEKTIPAFIVEKFRQKTFNGELNAAVLYLDIAGFTSITEKLMQNGKDGAERTSEILNEVFTECIQKIYTRNGFIPHFMGDGFLALFPDQEIDTAISSAEKIATIFWNKKDIFEVPVSYKMGISHGRVCWKILKNKIKNTYLFEGPAIEKVQELERQCKSNAILYPTRTDKSTNEQTKNTTEMQFPQGDQFVESEIKYFSRKESIGFIGDMLISKTPENEYRNVIPCFVSMRKKAENSDDIISHIITESNVCGGYFKDVIVETKEIHALIYFGTPLAVEKPFDRALDFSLSILEQFGSVMKIGLSSGIMFSGFIGSEQRSEFLVIGTKVNLASRLCSASQWGMILADENIHKNAKISYSFSSVKELSIKGFSKPISAFKVVNRKPTQSRLQELIGREKELVVLGQSLEDSDQYDEIQIIHVVGEAGIGKSFLMDTFHRKLEIHKADNYTWITLPCNGIVHSPYNCFIPFFNDFFKQNNRFSLDKNRTNFNEGLSEVINTCEDRQAGEELLRTRSCLAALLGLHWENALYQKLDAKGKQTNTIHAIVSFISALASMKPVVLEIEDVHWIDSYSKEIFIKLLSESDRLSLVIITTGRYLDDSSCFAFDVLGVPEKYITLTTLDKRLSKKLTEDTLEKKLSDTLFEIIWEKSHGNPFFIEQIARYLQQSTHVIHKDGVLYPPEEFNKGELQIPESIQAVILARIDQLAKELKRLVKAASVLGREFAVEVLTAMLKKKNIEDMLNEGEKKDIWNSLSEIVYIFKHALIRDSVYQMQLNKQLRALHKLAAESIEGVYHNNLEKYYEDLAYHYEKADILDKTILYLEKAGLHAQKNFYNKKAIELYEQYLKLSKNHDIFSKKRSFIHNQLGLVYQHIGDLKKAAEIFKAVINTPNIQPESLGFAQSYLGWILYMQHKYQEALVWYERASKSFGKINHHKGIAITYGHFAVIYLNTRKYDQAQEFFNKKLELCNTYDLKYEKVTAYVNMGVLYRCMGQNEKALNYLFKVLEESRTIKNFKFKMAAYINIGDTYHVLGQLRKALLYYKKDLELCQKTGEIYQLSLLYEKLGKIYNRRKNYNIAFDFAERKLQLDKEFNYFVGQQKAYQLLGIISYNKRHYNEALRFYKKGLKLKEIHDKVFPLSYSYFNIGLVYEKMKKYTTSLLYFDKAIDLLPQSYEKNLTMLLYERALVYRKMRRYKKARTLFTDLKNLADDREQTKYIVLASIELNNIDFKYAVTKEDQEKLLDRTENLYEIAKNEEEKKNISKVVRSMKRRLEKNENRK